MDSLRNHVAGATVRHDSPFSGLVVPTSNELLPKDLRDKWVRPLYFGLQKPQVRDLIEQRLHLVDDEVLARLFACFDWRPRTAAAYLAALVDRTTFTTQIGRLLLRSDVCYAGSAYCMALAEFNTTEATAFLNEYLAYYLSRPDLWFDQAAAMGALSYLDRVNGTTMVSDHLQAWEEFVSDKPTWSLSSSTDHFDELMQGLHALKRGSR
jgi:hypothetical protein